jgi:hypothetical protein
MLLLSTKEGSELTLTSNDSSSWFKAAELFPSVSRYELKVPLPRDWSAKDIINVVFNSGERSVLVDLLRPRKDVSGPSMDANGCDKASKTFPIPPEGNLDAAKYLIEGNELVVKIPYFEMRTVTARRR